jgi:hypothetical protein
VIFSGKWPIFTSLLPTYFASCLRIICNSHLRAGLMVRSFVFTVLMGTSIYTFLGRIAVTVPMAALSGARHPHVPKVRSSCCAASALDFIFSI